MVIQYFSSPPGQWRRPRKMAGHAACLLTAAVCVWVGCAGIGPKPQIEAPAPSGVSRLPEHLNGRPWIEQAAALASSLGAGPATLAATDVAAEGDRVGGFVALPKDTCIVAYARGSRGVDDLDLFAFADDGTILGADQDADPNPAITICPPHPSRAYLAARVASGRGIVSLAVQEVAPANLDRVAEALGVRGRPDALNTRLEAWAGLDERVGAHRRLLGGHWEEIRRVAVQADARAPTRITALLEPNRCLDALVIPGSDFGQLDVTLYDMDDRVLTRAVTMGADRYGIVCSPIETQVAVEIRPHTGQGMCAVVLGRSPTGAEQLISGPVRVYHVAPNGDLSAERARRAKPLRSLGYPEGVSAGTGTADVGRRLSVPLTFPPGCTRIEIVAGRPLAGVSADLWDDQGSLLATGEAGDGPTLFVCGSAGRGRLDLEAISRPGPFAVELRKEASSPTVLVSHPIAAGRLLSILARRIGPFTSAVGNDAKAVHLDTTSLRSVPFEIPKGQCAEIVAALERGGAGLDLRIHDATASEELALVRGRVVAAARACATNRARKLTSELRLAAGEADALVLAHMLPPVPQ